MFLFRDQVSSLLLCSASTVIMPMPWVREALSKKNERQILSLEIYQALNNMFDMVVQTLGRKGGEGGVVRNAGCDQCGPHSYSYFRCSAATVCRVVLDQAQPATVA